MLSKLRAEPGALRAVQAKEGEPATIQLRMLVHSRLCGTLIGKGGATIRSFNEDSRAVFNISPPPTVPGGCPPCTAPPRPAPCVRCVLWWWWAPIGRCLGGAPVRRHHRSSFTAADCCHLPPPAAGLTERIVKITGDVDELMRAVALVVTKLSENPDYHLLTDANLTYSMRFTPSGGLPGGPPPPQQQQPHHHQQQQQVHQQHHHQQQAQQQQQHQQYALQQHVHQPQHLGMGGTAPHMLHMGGGGGGLPRGGGGGGGVVIGGFSATMGVPEDRVGVVIGKQVRVRVSAWCMRQCGAALRCAALSALFAHWLRPQTSPCLHAHTHTHTRSTTALRACRVP